LLRSLKHYRVSSVLNDDPQFSKRHLIDGRDDTCWNSDAGETQSITLKFRRPVNVRRLELTFQGGFAPGRMSIIPGNIVGSTIKYAVERGSRYSVADNNSRQGFVFSCDNTEVLRIVFTDMSDDFGRVIVYQLTIYGEDSANQQPGSPLRETLQETTADE